MALLPAATTLLLLLLVSLSPTGTTAETNSDVILDVDGKPLEAGSEYYIQRADAKFGGRIRTSARPDWFSCPLYPMEVPDEVEIGTPVKFIPYDKTQIQIPENSQVRIDSGLSVHCKDDGLWKVAADGMNLRLTVTTSGFAHVPRGWFTIHKFYTTDFRNVYKITYAADDSTREGPFNQDLTLYRDSISGVKLLGLTENIDEVMHVVFIKNIPPITSE